MGTPYRDEPARPNTEPREEVLRRVEREQEEALRRTPSDLDRDPSTRSGFGVLLLLVLVAAGAVGYLVTFVVVGVLRGWEPAFHSGFAGALVLAVLAALVFAGGEDGRVARWVEARRGRRG
jgi:hypothetical protein